MLDSFAVSPKSTVIKIGYRNMPAVTEPNFIFRKCFGRKLIPLQCKSKCLSFCILYSILLFVICYSILQFAIPITFLLPHSAIAITVSRAVSVAEHSDQRFSDYGTPATDEASCQTLGTCCSSAVSCVRSRTCYAA